MIYRAFKDLVKTLTCIKGRSGRRQQFYSLPRQSFGPTGSDHIISSSIFPLAIHRLANILQIAPVPVFPGFISDVSSLLRMGLQWAFDNRSGRF